MEVSPEQSKSHFKKEPNMALFEKATRQKIRFNTSHGFISVEDLWDLKLIELNNIAKSLHKSLKEAEEVDFLDETSEADTIGKLKFDLVIHVLETKKAENKEKKLAAGKKAEKEKILAILAKKQEDSLAELSEDQLKAKLAELA
jgi:hypothetical protein